MDHVWFGRRVLVLLLSVWFAGMAGHALAASSQLPWIVLPVSMWSQGAQPGKKYRFQRVKINTTMLQRKSLWDHQYKKQVLYAVIPLHSLLGKYKHRGRADIALLRFANGVVIPYPLDKKAAKGRSVVYLALARWSKRNREWTRSFSSKGGTKKAYRDVKTLHFAGHKIVVSRPWHPLVSKGLLKSAKGFQPWRHADSLASVTFATRLRHRKRFSYARTKQETKGQKVFFQLCQFCHGVRQVGASFGVDFVSPHPVYRSHRSMSLLWHVRYRSMTSVEHGAMMPAIRGMTRRDTSALWLWLRAAARYKVKRPPSRVRQTPTSRPIPRRSAGQQRGTP